MLTENILINGQKFRLSIYNSALDYHQIGGIKVSNFQDKRNTLQITEALGRRLVFGAPTRGTALASGM
ncbi:MAG: hypothetical protein AAFV80_03980 [Bacteroidota bacterium]